MWTYSPEKTIANLRQEIRDLFRTIEAHERCEESLRAEIKQLKEAVAPVRESHRYWNYQVIKVRDETLPEKENLRFAIHEVHHKDDRPTGYVKEPCEIATWRENGESDEEMLNQLNDQIALMRQALSRPILDAKDFEMNSETEHGISQVCYSYTQEGTYDPTFICLCGKKFQELLWGEAGAAFDQHLEEVDKQ